jgi:putative tryptophan/tyrosine transport system substrate-binding protein
MGLQIEVHNAATAREISSGFANFERTRPDAVFVAADAFFTARRVQLAQLAAFHRLPAAFSTPESAAAGGLMSYGSNVVDAWRQAGTYVGRILKGAKPADLPVVQSSKLMLVVNVETARMLGLTVPATLR